MDEKRINNKFEHVETMLKNVIKYVDYLKEDIIVDMLTTEYEYEHSANKLREEMIKALKELVRLSEILKANNISI